MACTKTIRGCGNYNLINSAIHIVICHHLWQINMGEWIYLLDTYFNFIMGNNLVRI